MSRTGFYSGSFDPPTNGHLDVIERSVFLCDRIVVGIGAHATKAALFTPEERVAMVLEAAGPALAKAGVKLDTVVFSGLAVEAGKAAGANLIIRGLRDATDFDYEMQMAGMNAQMAPGLKTVFLPASAHARHISSTLVRPIAQMGGDVSLFAPANVVAALKKKFPSA
jgi:pantetheine-phosphate adenylyltransferase